FDLALLLWTALLVGAALFAWRLVAPGAGLTRAAHLALFLGLFPTAFGLMVGQPVALVAAAVAASWWLAERKQPVPAGLVLSLIAIKPQLALLVPLCLLVSRHGRVFGAWLGATAVLGPVGGVMVGSGATSVQVALMVIGYALLELALLVLAVPILLAEAALLLSLAWPSSFRSAGAGEALENSGQRSVGVRRV